MQGIKITRKGNWPSDVVRSKSTDFYNCHKLYKVIYYHFLSTDCV